MARELGLNPHSLIKNIPSPNQQWKLPVKHWVHELYEKKTGKTPVQKHLGAQSLKRRKHAALGPVPLHTYADEPALLESRDNALHVAMEEWEAYVDASWDDNAQWLPEFPLFQEIREENQQAIKRQDDFRLAARYVAQGFEQISCVEKVVLFGSVACTLQEEQPRYRKYRRAGIPMLHMCKDIDLAVWVSDTDCLRAMQKARSTALTLLLKKHGIGVAHHQVDVFIMEPGSNRYLGRLCTHNQCPKGKSECRVPGCGSTQLLRQHEDFQLNAAALLPGRSIILK